MAPKESKARSKKKGGVRQSTLQFRTEKRGSTSTSLKGKGKAKAASKSRKEVVAEISCDEEDAGSPVLDESRSRVLDVHDKAGSYRRYFKETQKQMDGMKPIHFADQPKVYQMLRVFDNTYDYGPCAGLTRLERWQRAEMMGLNPPPEVKAILLTEQGQEDPELIHPVFYGQVL